MPGSDWKLSIRNAMRNAHSVVLCCSQELEARTQSGMYPEILDAISVYRDLAPGSIFLIPVRLSSCNLPLIEIDATRTLDRLQYVDLFPISIYDNNFNKLLQAIRKSPNYPR